MRPRSVPVMPDQSLKPACAALTAASRVYDHKHWASDVLLGAGIGTVGGLMTVRWHDRHP